MEISTINKLRVSFEKDFSLVLPEMDILAGENHFVVPLNTMEKKIFIALLLNGFMPDEQLRFIARSYQSVICQLRKVIEPYDIVIRRRRSEGYLLTEDFNARRTS